MSTIDEILNSKEALENASNPEELGFMDKVGDVLAAPIRGIEGGLVRAPYNLVDDVGTWIKRKVTGDENADFLPDYEKNFTGESKTFVGRAVQGLTEFASVFVPVAGATGRVAKGTSVVNKWTKGSEAVKDVASFLGKGGIGTGAVADIVTYNKNNGTLTDTFKQLGFESDLTKFLETDEDDSPLAGRLKSAIEGGLLGAGFNKAIELAEPLFKLVKKQRALSKAINKGASEEELQNILKLDNLTETEKQTVTDWLNQIEVDKEQAAKLLADNKDLKVSVDVLKDMDFDITDQHILTIAKANYKNIVDVNNRLVDIFGTFKQTSTKENLDSLFDEMYKLSQVTSLQGKSLQALKGQAAARKATMEESAQLSAMKVSIDSWKKKSPEELSELMELVKRCDTPQELRSFLKDTLTKVPPSKMRQAGEMIQEFWKNSLLSSVSTHALNIGSNAFMLSYDKFKQFATGLFKGDMLMLRQATREFRSMFSNAFQATRFAWKSFASNWNKSSFKGMIDSGSTALTDTVKKTTLVNKWSKQYVGNNAFGTVAEYLGYVFNTPMKVIGSMDEGFKQLAVRTKLEGELFADAVQKGLQGADLENYIKQNLDQAFNESGQLVTRDMVYQDGLKEARARGIKESGERLEFAENYTNQHYNEALGQKNEGLIEYARKMTFQEDLGGISKSFQQFAAKHPLTMGWFFPFVKTPMNVLRTAWNEFVPLQSTFDLVKSQLFNADPAVKAEAMARFAVSTTLVGSILGFVNDGIITGSGPTNAGERNNLLATGWQPYSIKFGNRYISYSRLDPLATPLGLVADVFEQYNRGLIDEADGSKLLDAVAISMVKLTQSKSYLQGAVSFAQTVSNIGNPNADTDALMGKFLGSFVPSFIANAQGMVDGDDPMIAVRGVFDGIKSRLGFDSTLEVRRNLLGEELKSVESQGGALVRSTLPVRVTQTKEDKVLTEIANSGVSTGQPSHKMQGVDLREIVASDGRSAYSHYLDAIKDTKIRGKTLRQSLESLIDSNKYQKLPADRSEEGIESARAVLIKAEISRYREKAKKEFLKSNPQVAEKVALRDQLRKDVRRGETSVHNAITSLLRT